MTLSSLTAMAAAPLSYVLVGFTRRYLVQRGIVDVPSGRSSHSVPTPRGGGLSIVAVVIGGIVVAALNGWIPATSVSVLIGGGVAIAAIGWMDDRQGLSPIVRLTVHVSAAIWAVYWLGGFDMLRLGSTSIAMDWASRVLSVLVITWSISAYNFMDGLDALAGSEAVLVGFVGGAFALLMGHQDIAFLSFLIGAASLGFLLWNLPPAKVFLGDVGSGFLGYCFVVLALLSERQRALPAVGWLILLGVFAFDSTVTLLRRIVRGENWRTTHRESAYQRAALRFGHHGPVTIVVLVADVVLAALCWFGWKSPQWWPAVVGVATALLALLYLAVERYAPVVKTGAAS